MFSRALKKNGAHSLLQLVCLKAMLSCLTTLSAGALHSNDWEFRGSSHHLRSAVGPLAISDLTFEEDLPTQRLIQR